MTTRLILGDCVSEMAKLPDSSVDFILADYPFNCQDGRKDYMDFVFQTATEFLRLAKPTCNLLVINNPHNIFKSAIYYQDEWTLINGVALVRKGSLRPAWHLGFQHNYALLLSRGDSRSKWNGPKVNHDKTGLTDVIPYQNGYRGKGGAWHPQAIPLELIKRFVEYLSNPGDSVLDPFLGSGSTGLACKELKRDFIGIEFDEKYFLMAKKRIGGADYQGILDD